MALLRRMTKFDLSSMQKRLMSSGAGPTSNLRGHLDSWTRMTMPLVFLPSILLSAVWYIKMSDPGPNSYESRRYAVLRNEDPWRRYWILKQANIYNCVTKDNEFRYGRLED